MDSLRQDLAYALRRLRHSPGFSLVAIATLALGIGANAAIFSVVHAVLLRPLPFEAPERLVRVAQTWEGRPVVYSPGNFLDLETQARSFEALAAVDGRGVTLTGAGEPARLEGADVSAGFFGLLRVRPIVGRGFLAGENEPGHAQVVVLGHRLWQERFGGDPGIVGRTVQLNRKPYLVVGVAPRGFSYPEGAEIWTPLEYDQVFRSKSRGAWYLSVIGRLNAGVTVARARDEVATIAARLARQYPDDDTGVGGTVIPLREATVGGSRKALLVLLGAVGLVLLIACVNVANLLLARVTARETELALRSALGAGRGRVLRQLLTESVLLASIGGAAGLGLAAASLDTLLALQPQGIPRLGEVRVDATVLGFGLLLSVLTGLAFGIAPALHLARRATAQVLREGSRAVVGGPGSGLRRGLVVGQLAVALVLLAGSGLLLRSFVRLLRVDPGFRAERALSFRVSLPESSYSDDARLVGFYDRLETGLGALPGVRSVGAVLGLPLAGLNFDISFTVEGRPPVPPAQQPTLEVRVATPGYFRAIGIPIRRGRGFTPADTGRTPQVVVLSESAVRRYFQGQDPFGQRIHLGLGRGRGRRAGGEVVGIVGDVKERGLDRDAPPEIYLPYAQFPVGSMSLVVRSAVPPRSLLPAVRGVVHDLDPELPLAQVATLDEIRSRSVSEPRFVMVLLAAFAAMALLLAALGTFGVMSYGVASRSRELGIRVALGADPAGLSRMVLGDALLLAGVGVAVGLAGALGLTRAISGLLFETSPTDPLTLAAVAALLALVALVASYGPARRATRSDPVIALRSE